MKKLILMFFALVFSVSASFGYRVFHAVQQENNIHFWCDGDGGSCLPTVTIVPERLA